MKTAPLRSLASVLFASLFLPLAMLGVTAFAAELNAPQPSTETLEYLPPDLRSRVNQMVSSLDSLPTDTANASTRAQTTWEWINAHALNGGYVPVNATQIVASVLGQEVTTQSYSPTMLAALDATIRELAFIDQYPDGLGTLTADTGPFVASSYATIHQTYTVGTEPIQTGGGFLLARHFMANFGPWQTNSPDDANYLSITSTNPKVSFTATTQPLAGMHGGFRSARETLTFRIASGTLHEGDQVTIAYGDSSKGSPGMRMPSFSSDRMPLPIYVALHRDGQFFSLPIQPIQITGNVIAGVAGFAPSVVAPGEPFEFAVRAQDRFYNRANGQIPNWRLTLNGNPWQNLEASGAITVSTQTIAEPGVYYIGIESIDAEETATAAFSAIANPILVTAEQRPRIYWGDTHGHSGFAEGIGTPTRFMEWARDDARLDYVTHSEHDIWLDDAEWEVLRTHVRDFTEEGRFIAYLGYEWTVRNLFGGHHNVLFRTPTNRQRIPAQHFPTLSRLYQGLKATAEAEDIVIIPHAHQSGDYRQSDPDLEPLIEIMSQHGNFEWFGHMYLQHGHQVGFTAASDNHLSQPGYSAPQGGSLSQRGGLGAILAGERSTDAIFDSMRALQTYATTGDRMILEFAVNQGRIGQRIPFAAQRSITGRVIGTAPIDTITIVRNGEEIWQQRMLDRPEDKIAKRDRFMLTFNSDSMPVNPGDNPRGWREWSGTLEVHNADLLSITPVDSSFPMQEVGQSDNSAVFSTKTRGDTSSYIVELDNIKRNTRLQFDLVESIETGGGPPVFRKHQRIPAKSFSFALRDFANGRIEDSQIVDAYTDTISMRRIIEQGQKVVSFEFSEERLLQGDHYYVRVTQANDAIAWSSPIWVGGFKTR